MESQMRIETADSIEGHIDTIEMALTNTESFLDEVDDLESEDASTQKDAINSIVLLSDGIGRDLDEIECAIEAIRGALDELRS